jgi:hypothetical protein
MNHHKPRDRLRLLEINFQSITNKSADLQMAIDSSQPDIIIGTETWLTKDMNSSESIPNDFEVFRRDRGSDPHGGVLIACRRSLVGSIVHIGKTTEFIGIKMKLLHGKASGCDESIAICKSADLFVMLWKFISNTLNLSLGLWWFILLGDDAAVGSPN